MTSREADIVERPCFEALSLRSVAQMEKKKGNDELSGIIVGAADLIERLSQENEGLRTRIAMIVDSRAFAAADKLIATSCDGWSALNLGVHIRDLRTVLRTVRELVEKLAEYASHPVTAAAPVPVQTEK
jgi:hypothetical protein